MSSVPLYVTDTHSLLWYLGGSPKLSSKAKQAFDEAHAGRAKIIVPIIVVAELIFLVEKGRAKVDVNAIVGKIVREHNYEVAPLGLGQIQLLKKLIQIPEMHDRLIACEALLWKAKLITADVQLRYAGIVEVVW